MMLDDVIGSDRDEFPLEQVQGPLRHPCLEEDWDDAVALPLGDDFGKFSSGDRLQEPISG
jgi:hypothetical protein